MQIAARYDWNSPGPDVRGQPATDTGGDRAMKAAITPPRPLGVHHVKVPVTDLGRSRAWYESVFGIEMMIEFPDDDGTVRGVAYAPINQLTLSLREDPERAAALAGFDSWAVLVDSRADLDAWAPTWIASASSTSRCSPPRWAGCSPAPIRTASECASTPQNTTADR